MVYFWTVKTLFQFSKLGTGGGGQSNNFFSALYKNGLCPIIIGTMLELPQKICFVFVLFFLHSCFVFYFFCNIMANKYILLGKKWTSLLLFTLNTLIIHEWSELSVHKIKNVIFVGLKKYLRESSSSGTITECKFGKRMDHSSCSYNWQ